MKKLYGVTTAMITPFDEDGALLTEQARDMVEFLIRRGVHCLYPCGTTGEMLLMPEATRKQMAETVVRQADHRVTVYIHAGAMDEDETIRLARHACDIGADGAGVVTPAFFGTHADAMVGYYQRVLRSLPEDFPVYLYNIPQCAANDLTADVARRIVDSCPNAAGIKYSFPDMARTDEYLAIGGDFEVMHGSDRFMLPMMAMGCKGAVSGVSSVYPEPFVKVYEAFRAGDMDGARKWQRLAGKFVTALRGGSNMAYFKSGLTRRGVFGGHMHKPQMDLTKAQEEELYALLDVLEAECPEGLLIRD